MVINNYKISNITNPKVVSIDTNEIISGPFSKIALIGQTGPSSKIASTNQTNKIVSTCPTGITDKISLITKISSTGKIVPIVHHGLIAQELDKLVKDNKYNFGGLQNNNDNYTIGYTELIAPLIKSVQELTYKNKELSEQNKEIFKQYISLFYQIKEVINQNKELNYNVSLNERINNLEKKLYPV